MTGSASDTATIALAENGALSITTEDNAAAAANISITADGTATGNNNHKTQVVIFKMLMVLMLYLKMTEPQLAHLLMAVIL